MWVLRMLLILILVVAITWFAMINSGERATISLGTAELTFENVPLVLLLFEAFVIGAVVWFFVSIFHEFTLRRRIHALQRENKDLQQEIAGLRSISLDGIESEPEVEEELL